MFPTLLFVALVTFVLAQAAPGSPFERNPDKPLPASVIANLTQKYGLDRPVHEQFGIYVWNAVRFDFGDSIVRRRPVSEIIGDGLPKTAQLGLQALVVALTVAIPLGIISALRQNTVIDYGSMLFATIGTTIPSFVLGLFAIYAVGSHLAAGDFDGHVVLAALAGVLAFLAAGLSVAWLRSPASDAVTPRAESSRPYASAAR